MMGNTIFRPSDRLLYKVKITDKKIAAIFGVTGLFGLLFGQTLQKGRFLFSVDSILGSIGVD